MSLLRFVHLQKGVIEKVQSTCFETHADTQVWYSLAKLKPSCLQGLPVPKNMEVFGGGWHRDKKTSQSICIVEAIERLAYFQSALHPQHYGFHLDATSTGFAAAPLELGVQFAQNAAYFEALERWALHRISDRKIMSAKKVPLHPSYCAWFREREGEVQLWQVQLPARDPQGPPPLLVLALFHFSHGGVAPGSAVGENLEQTCQRALFECFNHVRKLGRLQQGLEKIDPKKMTEQRLMRYASDTKLCQDLNHYLHHGLRKDSIDISAPQITFDKAIEGFWTPELYIHRTLVENSPPLNQGDDTRLLI